MKVTKAVSPAFEDFLFDWDYERYLLIGGYGSGKSYHIAFKIILNSFGSVVNKPMSSSISQIKS